MSRVPSPKRPMEHMQDSLQEARCRRWAWGRGPPVGQGQASGCPCRRERPPKEANRLLGHYALAAAGGETFIAPGGGALAQPSRRALSIREHKSARRRALRPRLAPLPCPAAVHSCARAVTYHHVHGEHSPARLSALVHRCSRHLAESASPPSGGEQKAFYFPVFSCFSSSPPPLSLILGFPGCAACESSSGCSRLCWMGRTHPAPTRRSSQTVQTSHLLPAQGLG